MNGENKDALYQRLYDWPGFSRHFNIKSYVAWLVGCNLRCWFCSLPFLSRPSPEITPLQELSEKEFVNRAIDLNVEVVSFFGGEPTLHYEYVIEAAQLCKNAGITTILTTNGYINPCLARKLGKIVDQPVVGIKGSASPALYARMDADPQAVLRATRAFWEANDQTSLTDLVGPGLGATSQDQERLAGWICDNLRSDISIVVQALAGVAGTPRPFRPYVGGAENAHDEVSKVASMLTRNGLTNISIKDPCEIERASRASELRV